MNVCHADAGQSAPDLSVLDSSYAKAWPRRSINSTACRASTGAAPKGLAQVRMARADDEVRPHPMEAPARGTASGRGADGVAGP